MRLEDWIENAAAVEGTVITHLVAEPRIGRALLAMRARLPLPFGMPLSIRATRRIRGRMRAAMKDA